MILPPLNLTPDEIAWAKKRYMAYSHTRGAAALARHLGVSRDGLLRHIDPEYRKKRNASSAKNRRKRYIPRARRTSNEAKYAMARAKVTLVSVKMVDNSSSPPCASANQF